MINCNTSKLTGILYLLASRNHNINSIRSPWISFIKGILDECGLCNIYLCTQVNVLWLKHTVKRILCDQYLQQWNSENNSSRGINYRMFKHDFKLENYLLKLSTKNARILCKFKTGNVKLPIETGRWFNIERDDRICHLCNSDVGDEFHYIFNCTSLSAERNEYIPIIQIEQVHFLFSIYSLPKNNSLLCKLCKYLQIVIERVHLPG